MLSAFASPCGVADGDPAQLGVQVVAAWDAFLDVAHGADLTRPSRLRGVGAVTIKKRGTAVEPEQLRRQLKLSGTGEATVVLTRVAGAQTALLVQPL